MLKCTSSQGVVMLNPFGLIAIGELGRRTGLASSALRYYERVGLLSPTARAGGRRHYGASSAERVALIQLCQDAGFTLREIRALLAAWTRRGRRWARLAESKLRELDSRIFQAERAWTLDQHALACPDRNLVTCPNFREAWKAYLDSRERPSNAADGKAVPRVMPRRGKGARGVTERRNVGVFRQTDVTHHVPPSKDRQARRVGDVDRFAIRQDRVRHGQRQDHSDLPRRPPAASRD